MGTIRSMALYRIPVVRLPCMLITRLLWTSKIVQNFKYVSDLFVFVIFIICVSRNAVLKIMCFFSQANSNNDNMKLVSAILVAALYPNVVQVLTPESKYSISSAGKSRSVLPRWCPIYGKICFHFFQSIDK